MEEEYAKIIEDAKAKLEELQGNATSIMERVVEANQELDKLKNIATDSELGALIEKAQSEINIVIQEVGQKRVEIGEKIADIDSFYNSQFVVLKNQALDPDSGIGSVLTTVQEKSNSISDFEQQAKAQFEGLKSSVETYNSQLAELMKLEAFNKTVSEANGKVAQLSADAELIKTKVEEANGKLNELKSGVSDNEVLYKAIVDIQENIKLVQQQIETCKKEIDAKSNDIFTFHADQYIPLKEQILNPTTGIDGILSDTKAKAEAVASLEREAKIHFDALKNSVDQYNSTLESLKTVNDILNKFFDDSKVTANDQLTQIKSIKADIDTLLHKIKFSEAEAGKIKDKIGNSYEEAKKLNAGIEQIKKDSDLLKGKINTIYDQANSDTLGGAFGKQVSFLQDELKGWGTKIQIYTGVLLGAILLVLFIQLACKDWKLPEFDASFFLRFTITTPIIFYLAFCTKQYSIIRTSLDRYIFKKNMALSVEAHTSLLKLNFPNAEKERLDFSIGVMNKIYDYPYYDEAMKVKHGLELEQMKFNAAKHNLEEYVTNISNAPSVPNIPEKPIDAQTAIKSNVKEQITQENID